MTVNSYISTWAILEESIKPNLGIIISYTVMYYTIKYQLPKELLFIIKRQSLIIVFTTDFGESTY